VNIAMAFDKTPGQWVCSDASVLTDAKGNWTSPPLPKDATRLRIGLAHPAYTHGTQVCEAEADLDKLQAGNAVLVIKPQVTFLKLAVVDEQGNAVAGAVVRSLSGGLPQASDKDGKVTVAVSTPRGPDKLMVQREGYAPLVLADVAGEADVKDGKIVLEKGQRIVGQVVDPDGKPVAAAVLEGRDSQAEGLATVRLVTDKDGRFEWAHAPAKDPRLQVFRAGFLREVHTLDGKQESSEIKLKPLPAPAPGKERDPRYDPFQIFRRIS
jgi:hypothetical protein